MSDMKQTAPEVERVVVPSHVRVRVKRASRTKSAEAYAKPSVNNAASDAPEQQDVKLCKARKSDTLSPADFDGFGVRRSNAEHILPHHFRVEIPAGAAGLVQIIEDYGLLGGEGGVPYEEVRVALPRAAWSAISQVAKNDFNARLKGLKIPTGQWRVGAGRTATKVERLLGKELCVLAWAAEGAGTKAEYETIAKKWASLRQEERWWLFSMVVAEAGGQGDKSRGWRQALYLALSDAGASEAKKVARRPAHEEPSPLAAQTSLF